MGKGKKIKDLNPPNNRDYNEYEEFKGLLMNAFVIEGITNAAIERYVKNLLIEGNKVGYDKITKKWGNVSGSENNEYGAPATLMFTLSNGKTFYRPASYEPATDGAYLIEGIPAEVTFADIINASTAKLQLCDSLIKQNLIATRAPCIVVVDDDNLKLSVETALQQEKDGLPVIKVSRSVGESLKGITLNTPYIVDRVYTFRQQIRDSLINKLGTMSANINKRERVQVGEINATVGQCEDYLYMLIDNINRQFKSYGLTEFKAIINNSLEELYGAEEPEATTEEN